MSISEMGVTLFAVNRGYFDDVDVKRVLECEKSLLGFLKSKYADLLNGMQTSKSLDADGEKILASAIEEFKASWA
jgi:F-type H+-transporting ATPase subunit alpha